MSNPINVLAIALVFVVVVVSLCDCEPSTSLEQDIANVENSLEEVHTLLKTITADPQSGDGGQYAELAKHVEILKEQMRLLQEEYQLNKNMEAYEQNFDKLSEQFRHIGDKLKRDLQTQYDGLL